MTHRERFHRLFTCQPIDRVPLYFFGAWPETKRRWQQEGFPGDPCLDGDRGPQLPGMDPDWEDGLWNAHGLARLGALGDVEPAVLSERDGTRVVRNHLGKEELVRTDGSSIAHTLKHPLAPTRDAWAHFKRFLDPSLGQRHPADLPARAAARNAQDIVTGFMGGSFYGWLRDFMGVTELSYLMYDDPGLLAEMVETLADHFMAVMRPVLPHLRADFVYFFEDCCGATGPLFSPAVYRDILDVHYRRLIRFYKDNGVPLALIDSDGRVEPLVDCWLASGFDIVFPLEVGKWGAHPTAFRARWGDGLRMLGGVDKRLLSGTEEALRAHLCSLRPEVQRGGYLPIPDHRIPPEVSYAQVLRYIRVFHEVFNGG